MEVWYLLDDKPEQQEALKELYKKLPPYREYKAPDEGSCVLRVSLEIGDTEEADRQMRIASKVKRRPK